MSELKIQTGDGAVVPGKDTAEKEQAAKKAKSQEESQANSLFAPPSKDADTGPDYTYSKIRFHKKDEVNVYAQQQDARYAIDPRLKKIIILAVALVACWVLVCILPTQIFQRIPEQRSLSVLLAETATDVQSFVGFFTNPDSMYGTYVLTALVTVLAGAAMALSGGIFQGSLKNALASPSTLGVTSGGTIGSIIYAVFVYPNTLDMELTNNATLTSDVINMYAQMSPWQLFLNQFGGFISSLLGCMIVVTLIMLIATAAGRGKVSNVALVVAGQVFTTLIALIIGWIRMWYYNHGDTEIATYLQQAQSSTFSGAYTLTNVLIFAIPLLLCMAVCFAMASRLSLLAFGDEEARSMGIKTSRMRNLMVAVCTIMTALVISFCGPVGFVGFLVPHLARKLIGPDFRYLLPACALIGGLLVLIVFYITELNIPYLVSGSTGMLTSIIGCVSFIVIALRGRRSSGGEWL